MIYQTSRDAYLIVPQTRYSAFSKAKLDLNDYVQAYGQVLYTNSLVSTQIGYTPTAGGAAALTIPLTNPFIPADLRPILASRPSPAAPFVYTDRLFSLGPRRWEEQFNTHQVLGGLTGPLTPIDGTWDVYYSHGQMSQVETRQNVPFTTQLQQLLNAPDAGASICAGGFNPFSGTNATLSDACKSYLTGNTHSLTDVVQDDAEASVQGRLFALPAGDLRFAAGADYRRNTYKFDPDQVLVKGLGVGTAATNATNGKISVKEVSGELLVPLFKKNLLAESLNLDLGYRYSKYDVSGSTSTYKASIDWRVVPEVLLRGGYARAVRAPNPFELFSSPTAGTVQLGSPPGAGDPCDIRSVVRTGANGAQVRALCNQTGLPTALLDNYLFTAGSITTNTVGNLGLKPEKADTYTVGAVYSPKVDYPLLHRPTITLDYYHINLKGAIQVIDAPTSLSKCFNLDDSNPSYSYSNPYCALLTRDAANGVPTATQPFLNLGGIKTSGIDVTLEDTIRMSDFGAIADWGSFRLSSAISYLDKFRISAAPGAHFVDFAETVNIPTATPAALPKWRGLTSINYAIGRYSVGLRWRYLGSMKDVTSVTRPANPIAGVPSFSYLDMNFGVSITDNISIDGGITNLTKKNPPIVGGTLGQSNTGLYDPLGRTYYIHLTAKL